MSHLITSPFPHLRVRRVTIDHNEIVIDAFLTIHANNSEESWLTEDLFAEYVKIYFFIIADSSPEGSADELASLLAPPEHRVDNIIYGYDYDGPTPNPEEWWRPLLHGKLGYKQVSFAEAVQSSYQSNLTTSELDRGLSSLKDINFSVKIADETG